MLKWRPKHRKALALLIEGQTQAEVSKAVGCSVRSIRTWMTDPEFRGEFKTRLRGLADSVAPAGWQTLLEMMKPDKSERTRALTAAVATQRDMQARKLEAEIEVHGADGMTEFVVIGLGGDKLWDLLLPDQWEIVQRWLAEGKRRKRLAAVQGEAGSAMRVLPPEAGRGVQIEVPDNNGHDEPGEDGETERW